MSRVNWPNTPPGGASFVAGLLYVGSQLLGTIGGRDKGRLHGLQLADKCRGVAVQL
jgi:hypothetical protein